MSKYIFLIFDYISLQKNINFKNFGAKKLWGKNFKKKNLRKI